MLATNRFELNLQGRVALVTGAATGIGRATALALAQAGAAVAINHLARPLEAATLQTEIEAVGGRALVLEADVTQAANISATSATSCTVVNSPSTVSFSMMFLMTPIPLDNLVQKMYDARVCFKAAHLKI